MNTESLTQIDACCGELDLHLKPAKCVSLAFDGKRIKPTTTFPMSSGRTCNIRDCPTKFLGIVSDNPETTGMKVAARLKSFILPQIDTLNRVAIRGECKTWVLNYVLLPSLHFHLMVNDIPKSHINALQRLLTSKIKKWLHLSLRTTWSTLFHPGSLNLKFLPQFIKEAKISLLDNISITYLTYLQVLECLPSLRDHSS